MRQEKKYSTRINGAIVAAQLLCACLLTWAAMPAVASRAYASDLDRRDAGELSPGSYLWDSWRAPSGKMNMIVDLSSQRAFVYRNDTLIGISTISSGKPHYETPDGTFTVLKKERFHRSNKYDDAPMPYMQRLTWSGLALHGGHPRGYAASHGCIRLPMGFAAALFKEETRGMQVVITGHAPARTETAVASRASGKSNSGQNNANAPEMPCCAPGTDPAIASSPGVDEGQPADQSNVGTAPDRHASQNPDQPRDDRSDTIPSPNESGPLQDDPPQPGAPPG